MSPLHKGYLALPNEIHDLILDFLLQLNGQSSRPLASICRYWRLRLSRSTFACAHLDQCTVISFSGLLESQFSSSMILPALRNLHLDTKGLKEWKAAELAAINHVLLHIAGHANLKSLTLSNNSEEDHYDDITNLIIPTFHSTSIVRLHRIIFNEPSHYAHFFDLFPTLQHIEFNDVSCSWSGDPLTKLPPGEFTLALVVYTPSLHRTNIKWTLTQPITSIKTEDLYTLGQLAKTDIHTLLREIGPALKELDVDLQLDQLHEFSLNRIVTSLDLSHTPRLRLIRIGSSTHVLSCLHWVLKVLCGLGSKNQTATPTLTVLAIRFASSRQFHLDRPFLRCLTRGLGKGQTQWGAVRRLQFLAHYDAAVFDDGVKQAITQCIQADLLPYHEQGLVGVTFLARTVCVCGVHRDRF